MKENEKVILNFILILLIIICSIDYSKLSFQLQGENICINIKNKKEVRI